MSIRKENYKSDLEIEVILTLGGVEIPVPDHDFALVFFTSGKKTYKCAHKGESWDNCKVVEGRLRCYLDNHGLGAGELQVEYYDYIPDSDFKDGDQLKVVPRALDIELIYGAGDDATLITAEVATDITAAIERANAISAELEEKVATDYYRGVGIESVEQTTTSLVDGGENIITVTLTDGEQSTFSVRNGGMNYNNYYTKGQVDENLRAKADLVDGVIPANQLPSFVDDVLEGRLKNGQFYPAIYNPDNPDFFPDVPPYTPERNKVYIETQYKTCYYWDGNAYQLLGGGGGGTQVQSDWSESDINAPAYIKHKPALAAVATTGSYNDLSDKPSMSVVDNLTSTSTTDALSANQGKVLKGLVDGKADEFIVNVSYNGSIYVADKTPEECCTAFNDGKRVIFQSMSPLPNDGGSQTYVATSVLVSGYAGTYRVFAVGCTNDSSVSVLKYNKTTITGTSLTIKSITATEIVDNLISTSTTSALSANQGKVLNESKANVADLAAVATSGSYTDLTDKPTIDSVPTSGSGNAVSSGGVYTALAAKQPVTPIVSVPSGAIAPTYGYDANKLYDFGEVSSVVFSTFNTASEIADSVNLYMFTFQVASGGTTLSLNANTMYPNGEDANSLEGLLSTEGRVFECTLRRIVVTENNEDVSYYLLSYLYFD